MKSLDEILTIRGAMMACQFTPDGKCSDIRSRLDLSPELGDRAGTYIATVTMLFNTLAEAFSKESHMRWTPQQGWTYSGGDWTVIVGGNRAVFAQTNHADIEAIRQEIIGEFVEERLEHRM